VADAAKDELTEPTASTDEPISLILPGQHQQMKEGLHMTPITSELLSIFEHARGVLKITSGEQLFLLGKELFTDPFLLLLKQGQWEEAMGLLSGWRAQFGSYSNGDRIDLLRLLGEDGVIDALEITKEWFIGGRSKFAEDLQLSPHLTNLTSLLESATAEILNDREECAERLSQLLWQLSLRNDIDDFDEESDSDSDFEDDLDYGSDGDEELGTPTSTPTSMTDFRPSDSPPAVHGRREIEWHDNNTLTLTFRVDSANANEQKKDAEESTIIEGLSDQEARRSIYLRNGVDWVLPDIVPTLEDWNKGDQLTFTPMFERYLGQQMMKEEREEDEP